MFLFIFPFFCAAYSFIFSSRFNLLSPSSMLSVPSKGVVHTQQSLQFIKINRVCSSGWILLASECPWFTLGVQGTHDWVHYKLVIMSLMPQMPWEYFRSWARCLCRKRNAFITYSLQASGSGWVMQNQKEQLAWNCTACVRKRTGSWQCQGRNGTLAPCGRTEVLRLKQGRETVPQNWGQHVILPWVTKSIIQERRWQCAFLVSRASPWGSWWPGYSAVTAFDFHAFANTEHADNPPHFSWRAQMLNSPSHFALLWKRQTHHNWQGVSPCYPSFLFWQRPKHTNWKMKKNL